MNKINRYIDKCLLEEYAVKNMDGYSLSVDDLSEHEINNFISVLMKEDTSLRDTIVYEMQKLIDARLIEFEVEKMWDQGETVITLSNGDYYIERMGAI